METQKAPPGPHVSPPAWRTLGLLFGVMCFQMLALHSLAFSSTFCNHRPLCFKPPERGRVKDPTTTTTTTVHGHPKVLPAGILTGGLWRSPCSVPSLSRQEAEALGAGEVSCSDSVRAAGLWGRAVWDRGRPAPKCVVQRDLIY